MVVLDLPAEIAHAQVLARREDQESLEYLLAARAVYLEWGRGWSVVDATGTTEAVITGVAQAVDL